MSKDPPARTQSGPDISSALTAVAVPSTNKPESPPCRGEATPAPIRSIGLMMIHLMKTAFCLVDIM